MARLPAARTQLRQVLADIFEAAWEEDICNYTTVNQLANAAGLSWITVDKLWQQCCRFTEGTKEPRFTTVLKLAHAVGMDIELAKEALAAGATH